ncbi:MAG: hypothetical protein R6V15_13380 [Desulfotignum sp.]
MSHDHNHEHGSSRSHTHEHGHTHEHDHTHPHEHSHQHEAGHQHEHIRGKDREDAQEMSLEDKLAVLLSHWVDHNDSHKDNFFSWAKKAEAAGLKEIATQLEQAGALSEKVTLALKQAQKVLNG